MTTMKVQVTEQFKKSWDVLTGKAPEKPAKGFLKRSRTSRLAEVEEKRQEILGDKRGKGIFATWCTLPEQEDYGGWRPMGNIIFTVSLSRKYDDIYYLYHLDTFDSHAYDIAHEKAEEELGGSRPQYHPSFDLLETDSEGYCKEIALTREQEKENEAYDEWTKRVEGRAEEIARAGVEITPYFYLNRDSSAGIEVIGVVDVKEFTADGTIQAITTFLDLGEIAWEGEPIAHVVSEEYLNATYVAAPAGDGGGCPS